VTAAIKRKEAIIFLSVKSSLLWKERRGQTERRDMKGGAVEHTI
jgi:hypothetical protein